MGYIPIERGLQEGRGSWESTRGTQITEFHQGCGSLGYSHWAFLLKWVKREKTKLKEAQRAKSLQYFHEETLKYSECVYGMNFKSWAANEAKPPTFLTIKAGVFL